VDNLDYSTPGAVSISLNSSAVREYEACYNEGGVEKDYGALYGQWLEGGTFGLALNNDKKLKI